MISVRDVAKSFGRVQAVRGISFEVPQGQVVGLLGANGAGKTTTLRMVVGFLPPDRGRIAVGGHDTLDDSFAARAAIGYLPESAPAYPEMAVEDFLGFRGRLYGLRRAGRRLAIDQAVERCDLQEVRRRRIGHLSKGFRQRVGLAAAILHAPDVLVLDEPTNGLDPRQIGHARRLIRQIAQGCTVLISSHILPEVEQTCDRVIVMSRGAIRADATPRRLVEAAAPDAPYIVEVRPGTGGAESVLAAVRSVAGVAAAERDADEGTPTPPWVRVRIAARADAPDLREPVAAALAGHGALVRELRRVTPSLERVVLGLIESEGEPADGPARGARA